MKKFSLLAMSVALALTGCGSDSSSSDDSATDAQSVTIQAIDGYLVNADVYIDRNENGVADDDEKLSETTDENGEVSISAEDAQYPVIIKAVAGQTYDTDKAGRLTESVELIAEAGSTVVTPFTTLAKIQNIELSELATNLNLPEELISGDYTASTDGDAEKAHLLARSVTQQLEGSIQSTTTNITTINTAVSTIQTAIEAEVNKGSDLAELAIDGNGTVSDMPPTLEEYFVGNTFYMVSTNSWYFEDEGMSTISFTADALTYSDEGSNEIISSPVTYTANTFTHTEDSEISAEEMMFRGENFAFMVTPQMDMNLYTKINLETDWPAENATEAMYKGKTHYFIFDDSTGFNIRKTLVALEFGNDNSVTLKEAGEADSQTTWSITNNRLYIDGILDNGEAFVFQPMFVEGDVIIGNEITAGSTVSVPYFTTTNKDIADSLYAQWLSQ